MRPGADGPGAAPPPLGAEEIGRLLVSIAADERQQTTRRSVQPCEWRGWGPATPVGEEGLGFDSIARLGFAARVSEFFRLHEIGSEDHLLVSATLGEWGRVVGESLVAGTSGLTFRTSGSSGAPKRCGHGWDALLDEAAAGAAMPGRGKILSCVPPHHIYGFLFTVLGPRLHRRAVVDLRDRAPTSALREAGPGDLVVATPHLWDLMLAAGVRAGPEVLGVSSGGPAAEGLWEAASGAGLARLVDVYGASETAGLGMRDAPGDAFALLPHLDRADGAIRRRADRRLLAPPDRLDWVGGTRSFQVGGRSDGAVAIAGLNVFPARVRDLLMTDPEIADCSVRPDATGPLARLKAFVATRGPLGPGGEARLEARLRRLCSERLAPAERPQGFTFGTAVPRTPTGKLADWSEAVD